MGRTLTGDEYFKLAAERGLEFKGTVPARATQQTDWLCLNCGTLHHKSFRTVKDHEVGCRCRRPGYILQEQSYVELAERLGIVWLRGEFMPRSNKQTQRWQTQDGTIFDASYFELAYDRMPGRVKKVLGLPYRERKANYSRPISAPISKVPSWKERLYDYIRNEGLNPDQLKDALGEALSV
jgi:hypothetical protein